MTPLIRRLPSTMGNVRYIGTTKSIGIVSELKEQERLFGGGQGTPLATATTSEAPSLPLSLPVDYIFPCEFEISKLRVLFHLAVIYNKRGAVQLSRDSPSRPLAPRSNP